MIDILEMKRRKHYLVATFLENFLHQGCNLLLVGPVGNGYPAMNKMDSLVQNFSFRPGIFLRLEGEK